MPACTSRRPSSRAAAQLFRLVMDPGNFGAVRQACRALGGDLASIRSDTEMNQVIALLDAEHAIPPVFYLGGAASGPGNWYVTRRVAVPCVVQG